MPNSSTAAKYDHLKHLVAESESAVVAFSGGVDSTFLLAVCRNVLEDRVLAVTATSEIMPHHELSQAQDLARHLGARHLIINSNDLETMGVADNSPERCYFCKKERFIQIKRIARKEGLKWVFDGSNTDDAKDFRPGRKAVHELGIRSPLLEAKLAKSEIRALSKTLGLVTWDQPSAACLASRIPYNTTITRSALMRIEKAEAVLRQLGMRVFRVRHFGSLARLELGDTEMPALLERNNRLHIVQEFESLGYQTVTVDLKGYRMGSLNEGLGDKDVADSSG